MALSFNINCLCSQLTRICAIQSRGLSSVSSASTHWSNGFPHPPTSRFVSEIAESNSLNADWPSSSHKLPVFASTNLMAVYGPITSVEMPNPRNKPSIGLPLSRKELPIGFPLKNIVPVVEKPSETFNKVINDAPSQTANIEKQAARLIVIRRIKMNKHKLRKLRKKMKFVWAKVRLRRKIRNEKAYLDGKMALIRSAEQFDAKEYVAGIIRKAKEEPIPYKWTDPLMPDWFREEEMKKEAFLKRYKSVVNLYLNKSIKLKE